MRFHIEETLDEYISGLADLVEAVNRLEGAHLIIRPHPACNITREEFTRLLPRSECLSILKKEQFSDILSAADILVSFSSTCIEEALQNKIPVILFDKWGRYNHFNVAETSGSADIVKKPVYYISSPLVLKECLPDILRIAGNNLLSDADLKEYRYPDGSGRNFDSFIDSLMEKQGAN
jgi:CDP-glycerol glycerophosphotransferase (TagB/SpsB family)